MIFEKATDVNSFVNVGSLFAYKICYMDLLSESLKLGITPAIVVAIYLIVTKVIENHKDNKSVKLNGEIVDCFAKLNNFLDYVTKDIINKEADKCDIAIKNAFKASANTIIKNCTYTIISNNIEMNKTFILDNLNHLINSEYSTLYNCLVLYNNKDNKITDYLNPAWKEEMIKLLTDVIYSPGLTKEEKLYNLNNRCNVRINDYCIEVLNKYIEHEQCVHRRAQG